MNRPALTHQTTLEEENNNVTTNTTDNEPTRAQQWSNATRKLKVGVAFATVLLLIYNIMMFLPVHSANSETGLTTSTLLLYVIYVLVALILAYFCMRNYMRGLSRFTVVFDNGGKRSLFIIRWGFLLTIAGVVLQLFVFFILHPRQEDITFLRMLIGNGLLVVATVLGIMGFLSLATCKGMPQDARRGALHMSWSTIVMLIGACLLSYALQGGTLLKVVTILVNIFGTYLFYHNWRRILSPADADEAETETEETTNE